ncbi:MAG: glycosyltransferase family 2 protein [Salibacteraceae bacterium]
MTTASIAQTIAATIDCGKVAVVLLSYNSKHLMEQLLPGIVASVPESEDYRLVVVDNGSTDGTPEFLQNQFPDVTSIRIEVNRGFTNGYAESLPRLKADYYVLLSSDVEVSPGWLEPSIAILEADPKVAIVQPKIRSYHQREEFEYAGAAGGFIDTLGYPFCRGRMFYTMEADEGQYDDTLEVFWASGACFFIRADAYHQSGGLDDDFFAHQEEIDLCWRLKNQGYKVMACSQSEVFHMGGAIITYGSPAKTYRNYRNNLIMLVKNLPAGELVWKLPLRLGLDALAFWKMVADGQGKAALSIISAHWSFFWHLPRWFRKRKEIRKSVQNPNSTGIYPRSVVWDYFAKRKQTFSSLNWRPGK